MPHIFSKSTYIPHIFTHIFTIPNQPRSHYVYTHPIFTHISSISFLFFAHSLHIVSTSAICLLLELHGSLGVRDGAVLLVPVVVLHQGRDTVGVHQDVAAEEGCLDNKWITVFEGGLDHKSMTEKDAWGNKKLSFS